MVLKRARPTPVLKALANDSRLDVLRWLKNPRANFPPQVDGDLVRDGVCGVFIAQKLGVSPNTGKTQIASLYQKLEVQRRTQAVQKARELALIP